MPFNVLLLPLLGGFLLLHRTYRYRYYLNRFSGHRLIFFSAVAGVGLLALSAAITYTISYYFPVIESVWRSIMPFVHSGTAFGALILGWCLPWVFNRIPRWSQEKSIRRVIGDFADDLEVLLLRSMDITMPVLITLSNGKVYVGYVTHLFRPENERKHLKVLPITSGYRDRNTFQVTFTTFYDLVMEEARDADSEFHDVLDRDFEVVIRASEIITASLFDFRTYEAFLHLSAEASGEP